MLSKSSEEEFKICRPWCNGWETTWRILCSAWPAAKKRGEGVGVVYGCVFSHFEVHFELEILAQLFSRVRSIAKVSNIKVARNSFQTKKFDGCGTKTLLSLRTFSELCGLQI